MLASMMLVRFSEIDADQVQLAVANPFLGDHLLGKLPNRLGRAFQADRFKALLVVQMHVHGGRSQFVVSVLQFGKTLGALTFMMVKDVRQACHAEPAIVSSLIATLQKT
jgi:hypothetical protein